MKLKLFVLFFFLSFQLFSENLVLNKILKKNQDEIYINALEATIYSKNFSEIKNNLIDAFKASEVFKNHNKEKIKELAVNASKKQNNIINQMRDDFKEKIDSAIDGSIDFLSNINNYQDGLKQFLVLNEDSNLSDYDFVLLNSNFNILWINKDYYLNVLKSNGNLKHQASFEFFYNFFEREYVLDTIKNNILLEKNINLELFKQKYFELAVRNESFEVSIGDNEDFYEKYVNNLGGKIISYRYNGINNDYFKYFVLYGDSSKVFPLAYFDNAPNIVFRNPAMTVSSYGVITKVKLPTNENNLKDDARYNKIILSQYEKDIESLKKFLLALKIEDEMRKEPYFSKLPKPLQEYLSQAPKYSEVNLGIEK